MAKIIPLSPASLIVDSENPRIADEGLGRREAMRAVAGNDDDGKILLALAEDIVAQEQLNPAELPIVWKSAENPSQYIVGEGNRRITAIKALENPDTFDGAVSGPILDRLRKLSAKYHLNPIEKIQCCLMADAAEAQHWIDLRHTGPNGGAGLVPWGPHQKARFQIRTTGKTKIHVALLDFLENGGHLSGMDRKQVPLASFERLVKSPAVRERIGMSTDADGKPRFINEQTAIQGLLYIIRDLISGAKKTVDIYTADQRTDYAHNIPESSVPVPKAPPRTGAPSASVSVATPASPQPPPRVPLLRNKKESDKLIPPDCRLRITEPRIRRIGQELQGMSLKEYPNAIATLFRVFLELSTDHYLVTTMKRPKNHLIQSGMTLANKLTEVVTYLEAQNLLSRQDAAPVKAACAKKSFLATSVTAMNEYVHNFIFNPTPTDLRVAWEGFEPFLKALWP